MSLPCHGEAEVINNLTVYRRIASARLRLSRRLSRAARGVTFIVRQSANYFLRLPLNLQRVIAGKHFNNMWSKTDISTTIVSSIANLILVVGLALGLYTRWLHSGDVAILCIAVAGLFVYSISLALVYYFSLDSIGKSLCRLYIGCMLGVVSFTEHSSFHTEARELTMNMLLVASLVIQCVNKLFMRFVNPPPKDAILVNSLDSLEMLGMSIASLATGSEAVAVTLLVVALAITIATIRLKSFLGVVNLVFIVLITGFFYFPKVLHLSTNPFSLSCFVVRISFEAVIDLYFCTLTTLEMWKPVLSLSALKRKLLISMVALVQLAFFSTIAKRMPSHKEWFIVVPMFAAFSVIWISFHLVFLVTCWLLTNKITECHMTFSSLSEGDRSMSQIMASKGVRHFSLISQRLVFMALASSVVVGLLGWTPKTALSLSLFCMVVPIESAVLSLLWELGSALGGTCIGYALVAPSLTVRYVELCTA